MGSLLLEGPEPLSACAGQGDVEGVDTGTTQSGVPTDATPRTSLDYQSLFLGTEDLGYNEFLSVGESKGIHHPTPGTGLAPPLLSPSSNTNSVFEEGLNRLRSFQDLARLRLKHATQIECYETTILRIPDSSSELDDYRDRRWAHLDITEHEGGDLGADLSGTESPLSSSPSTSTFLSSPSLTDHPLLLEDFFFDDSPESPEGSPTLPNPSDFGALTYRHMPPKTMPELAGLGDSCEGSAFLSSTWASSSGAAAAAHSAHLRPRSAPKNLTRPSNPFIGLWSKKGHHQQQQQQPGSARPVGNLDEIGMDSRAFGKRISSDDTAVESHGGKKTPPRSASGTPAGSKDAKEPASAFEGGGPPPLTREEFEALPLAIQRKYFSTLERLRFAQESTDVDDIYNHYDDITSHKTKRSNHISKRSAPDSYITRDSLSTAVSDSSWFLTCPERAKKTQLSRQEQCELVKHLRASVILDAADEAIYKLRHKSSNQTLIRTPEIDCSTSTLSSTRRGSFDSVADAMAQSQVADREDPARESLYESFRWLDEEEDLDLRLFLDDYHANLREELPQTSKSRRPSFRRHLSISKRPFGLSSPSGSQSDARDSDAAPAPPLHSTTFPRQQHSNATQHTQRLSRTLSLMNPSKHTRSESLTGIDPSAAHYQDPEARLKLRVYLASPQKFDEAIEFGFPASDSMQAPLPLANRRSVARKRQSRLQLRDDHTEHMRSFLDDGDDDDLSTDDDCDDDASSVSDPDSPRTPHMGGLTPPPGHHRPTRVSTDPLHQAALRGSQLVVRETNDSYMQIPANSREMTLRMTLTRPDLRADDEQIYGWQAQQQAAYLPAAGRKSQQSMGMKDEQAPHQQQGPSYMSQGRTPKESIEAILTGTDHWSAEAAGGEKGFMKRIFNRVRRA